MPLPPTVQEHLQKTGQAVDRVWDFDFPKLAIGAAVLAAAFFATRLIKVWIGRVLAAHQKAGTLEPESSTRLLMSRRLLSAVVWVLALAFTLSLFPHLRVLSAGLIASAGLSGLVVGFAARSTLGNAIAGITIAFAQPLRIGDDVEFRAERGIVEDITLLYTILRLGDAKRLVIPNDVLSSEVIKNLTMGQAARMSRTELLVPVGRDAAVVRQAMLVSALNFGGLDTAAPPPEVTWARIDERGVLLRLIATCATQANADQLSQRVMGRAVELLSKPPAPPA